MYFAVLLYIFLFERKILSLKLLKASIKLVEKLKLRIFDIRVIAGTVDGEAGHIGIFYWNAVNADNGLRLYPDQRRYFHLEPRNLLLINKILLLQLCLSLHRFHFLAIQRLSHILVVRVFLLLK